MGDTGKITGASKGTLTAFLLIFDPKTLLGAGAIAPSANVTTYGFLAALAARFLLGAILKIDSTEKEIKYELKRYVISTETL